MGTRDDETGRADGENRLRGKNLTGSEQSEAVDHDAQKRNPDREVRTDGEKDSLYDDGLEIDQDPAPLTGVNGNDDSR